MGVGLDGFFLKNGLVENLCEVGSLFVSDTFLKVFLNTDVFITFVFERCDSLGAQIKKQLFGSDSTKEKFQPFRRSIFL